MEFGVTYSPTHYTASPVTVAREAERFGFESLFVPEHSHMPLATDFPLAPETPMVYKSMYDPFVALAAAAAVTENLKVGTSIALIPQRDPIHTAKEVATLDQISNGRVVLGIGAGWNEEEMEAHGTDPKTRFRVMREKVEAIKTLWTNEVGEYHGRHVDIPPTWQWPKPVQDPHPPHPHGRSRTQRPQPRRQLLRWLAARRPLQLHRGPSWALHSRSRSFPMRLRSSSASRRSAAGPAPRSSAAPRSRAASPSSGLKSSVSPASWWASAVPASRASPRKTSSRPLSGSASRSTSPDRLAPTLTVATNNGRSPMQFGLTYWPTH